MLNVKAPSQCRNETFFKLFFKCVPAFGLNTERDGDTEYLFVFSPNAGKYGPETLGTRTLLTQRFTNKIARNSMEISFYKIPTSGS